MSVIARTSVASIVAVVVAVYVPVATSLAVKAIVAALVVPKLRISASRTIKLPVPRAVVPPTVRSPALPASNVRLSSVPVRAPDKTMSSPAASPVWKVTASVDVRVTAVANAMPSAVLVMSSKCPITYGHGYQNGKQERL